MFPFTYGYLEAGEFTKCGKVWSSIRRLLPLYLVYAVVAGALLMFLYLSDIGKAILISTNSSIIGVVQGINIAVGLALLSLILGFGMIKIP